MLNNVKSLRKKIAALFTHSYVYYLIAFITVFIFILAFIIPTTFSVDNEDELKITDWKWEVHEWTIADKVTGEYPIGSYPEHPWTAYQTWEANVIPVAELTGQYVIDKLPTIAITYINSNDPDAGNSSKKHSHYVKWYYKKANTNDSPKELTSDVKLEATTYVFTAEPGERIGYTPENIALDYKNLKYDNITNRSLTLKLAKTNVLATTEWKWRYRYGDDNREKTIDLDKYGYHTRTWGDNPPTYDLRIIETTNTDYAESFYIKASLPTLQIAAANGNIGKHYVKWYYRLEGQDYSERKLLTSTDKLKPGEYIFTAEVSAGEINALMGDYTRIGYAPNATVENRSIHITIVQHTEKITIYSKNIQWRNQYKKEEYYEIGKYPAELTHIYMDEEECDGDLCTFNGSKFSTHLLDFYVQYNNYDKLFEIVDGYSVPYNHKAIWQYRKANEPESANRPYNGEDLTFDCSENDAKCGEYIFTATIGQGEDYFWYPKRKEEKGEKYLGTIQNYNLLDLNGDPYVKENTSITFTFYSREKNTAKPVESKENNSDITINIFDYWLEGKDKTDNYNPDNHFNLGINKDHVFLFMNSITGAPYGKINGAIEKGIVQNTLQDGFPILNPDATEDLKDANWAIGRDRTESLDYLFNPSTPHNGKESHTNVNGLLQKDDEGYYYYDYSKNAAFLGRDNTGQIPSDGAKITLYDKPIVPSDKVVEGNFLPFNKFEDFADDTGFLKIYGTYDDYVNHYFGLTMEVPFRQTENGQIVVNGKKEDMIFDFKGDDDVWVFIDDVLVLDIGGMHPSRAGNINFRTGVVETDDKDTVTTTTLKDIFEKVNNENIILNGNTFADNTIHTLKMFYLERANGVSTMKLKFNLQPLSSNEIKKVDFDNKPLENVNIKLYQSDKDGKKGGLLATFKTDIEGKAPLIDENGNNFNFNDSTDEFYLLEESSPKDGYRDVTGKMLIHYNHTTRSLTALNQYTTGLITSNDRIIKGRDNINYGEYNSTTGLIEAVQNKFVSDDYLKNSLMIAVPMTKKDNKWTALYKNDVDIYFGIDNGRYDFKTAATIAALYEIYYNKNSSWNVKWDFTKGGINSKIEGLPGSADQYLVTNPEGDMRLEYILISGNVLTSLHAQGNKISDLHNLLVSEVEANGENVDYVISNLAKRIVNNEDFSFLDLSNFTTEYDSTITIPNDERELRVKKIDDNNKLLGGAKFSIFKTEDDAQNEVNALSTGVTNDKGMLTFKVNGTNKPGSAQMTWPSKGEDHRFYLKEIETQNGYVINETIIPIYIDEYAIYADAGDGENGIAVIANTGKLAGTMRSYASDNGINSTLKDIIVTFQTQDTNQYTVDGWQNGDSKGMYYNNANNGYYTSENGQVEIKVNTGFARVSIKQNYNNASFRTTTNGSKDEVKGDLNGVISLINTVEVTNIKQDRKISGIAFEDIDKDNEYSGPDHLYPDIKVSLLHNDQEIKTTTTDANGYYEFADLQNSQYVVQFEIPNGAIVIEKGDSDNSNKANEEGKTEIIKFAKTPVEEYHIEHVNLGLRSLNLILIKAEMGNSKSIIKNDGEFELYEYTCSVENQVFMNSPIKENESCFKKIGDTISTDDDGKLEFLMLQASPTIYRLVEVTAPKGYVRPSGEWNISIDRNNNKDITCIGENALACPAVQDNKDGTYTLYNKKMASMPSSGGLGQILITAFGITLMGLGVLSVFTDKNPKKRMAIQK